MKSKTIKDMAEVRSQMEKLAKKYGWQPREFADYVMRVGLNRCMALERYGKMEKAAAKPKVKAKPKAAKPKKAPKAKASPKPRTRVKMKPKDKPATSFVSETAMPHETGPQ